MPEPAAPHVSVATTQPQPVLEDSAPPRQPGPAAGRQRGLPASRISGLRDALTAGALVLAAAGNAGIAQLRQVMHRDRRNSNAG